MQLARRWGCACGWCAAAAAGPGPGVPRRRACPPQLPTEPPAALPPSRPAALGALTSLSLSGVPTVSDETLRLVGQRHPRVASLALAACGAVTGGGLGQHGAYPALRSLSLDACDAVTG